MNPSYRIGIKVELLLMPINMVFRFDEKLKDPHLHPITTEFINLEQPVPLELISPIFHYSPTSRWREDSSKS
ncbi:hypothetical protein LT330_007078 [Penicillium expansum]|nr:hypothetical protein LT330_007078 [Penicillium expansum]